MLTALGLMSGTSMDGVDVAVIRTDGGGIVEAGGHSFHAYSPDQRDLLREAIVAAQPLRNRHVRPDRLAQAEAMVTDVHAQAVISFMTKEGLAPGDIELVGFHGQTVLHRPQDGLTIQIGDGAVLSRQIGIDVVYDFRANDMERGGQGAPLVPVFHQALCRSSKVTYPVIVMNIGGVANITYLVADEAPPVACDIGPGNALIDDFMLERSGTAIDRDGLMAASGRVDAAVLKALLAHPFFDQKPPKSLDRHDFSRDPVASLTTADGAATLSAFTAQAAALILRFLPEKPKSLIIAGGGAFNPTLVRMLADAFGLLPVTADAMGWSTHALEAQAFAYLAVRSKRGMALTFPSTTGVVRPVTGGILATR